jgi:hypothetical protein
MSQRVRFFARVMLLSLPTASCSAPHAPTSPRAVGSAAASNTKPVHPLSSSSTRAPLALTPFACLPRVEVSRAPGGEDSWLAASNQALCCRFEGYVSEPPRSWAGGRDCLSELVPGLRPNTAFRAEMPLPYEMRLPLDGVAPELSAEQRQALDRLLQARQGRGGSAPLIRPSLPEDHFAQHLGRARKLAQLSLEYLRAGGLPQTTVAAENEWHGARGSAPHVVISGVENAVRSSPPRCTSGMTLYADVPVSARSLRIEACRNGVCSHGSAELPSSEIGNPAEPNASSTASTGGTPNAMVFALSGGAPAGALLTLRGTVEDSPFAEQKLEHPTLVPRATADLRALEIRFVPSEALRDGDRYSLSLFLDGATTPSLKAEQAARYESRSTRPECKNGSLTFSSATLAPAPR